MLLMSPYQHFEALRQQYIAMFPADTVIWGFGSAARAQNTERTRVIYDIAEDVVFPAVDEGYIGVGNPLWSGVPSPTFRVEYHIVQLVLYARHNVLYDQIVDAQYVPGLVSRVSTALEYASSGPFRAESTSGQIAIGTQNHTTGIWQRILNVRVPFPVSDLKGWLAQTDVVLAPITDIQISGVLDASPDNKE